MDLVVGPQEGSGAVLLTLTERKSRQEMIFKLPDKRACTIWKVSDKLERTMPDFYQRFKTITTDNGPEFLEYDKLVKSVLGGKRFTVYYCHSYAAWEKCQSGQWSSSGHKGRARPGILPSSECRQCHAG